ncbi:ParA family protein [Paracrocinitomix mangrovi]|uniref:ParA family protein n=1 Tax=Paracrocinitomix mangrovi TaxID=2862509 RepID=UPI001C8D4F26|nr:ParA family protein [Paracrocinitomix mangrovi]UKN01598.1 ParA family protein [Paracrocinitomix mangrovi]
MIISVGNRKGGTGKTTTVVNLGRALSLKGKNVLLVDLDPQANLSYSYGISTEGCVLGEVLLDKHIDSGSIFYKDGLDLIPSNTDLQEYEAELIRSNAPKTALKEALEDVKDQYDFILIDCPPTASHLTVNALMASDAVLIPMLMENLSLVGFEQMIDLVFDIKTKYHSELFILGVVGVLVDERRHLTTQILEALRSNYGVDVFNNYVRQNVKAAEAPASGQSVIDYAPTSNSAKDYIAIANELLKILNQS